MDPADIIVLIAIDLPPEQASDLIRWWQQDDANKINHPSLRWFIKQRAVELVDWHRRNYPVR